MKIGVCLFDDTKIAKDCWVSVAGGSPLRLRGISELKSDVFWITNLNYFEARNLNLNKAPNISDEQYFRTKISSLSQELTITDDPEIIAPKLSKILNRTHELGKTLFNVSVDDSDYRYTNALQNKLLTSSMRLQPTGNDCIDISEAIRQSTQENQAMTSANFSKGSKLATFTFSRASYAKWLMSMEYPTNSGWKKLKFNSNSENIIGFEDGVKIKGTDTFINKLIELDKESAALFRVSVISTDQFYLPFAKFGSGANKIVRRWATLPEVIDISRYCKISVQDGFYCKKSQINILDNLFATNFEYSISKGLLCENAWSSICTPVYSRDNMHVSSIGAYMRSYDRIACGRVAASFQRHGFTVGSYGLGRIQVSIRPGEESIAREVAIKNNVIPYMRFLAND